MKKKLLSVLLVIILLVAIPGTLMLAADISGALYKMSITVSNNGTLVNYVSTNGVISTPNLIAGGFLNSSANNCAVLDAADNDVPFMPGYSTNPWAFWVETIGADSYLNYDLYTADTTNGSIAYFPDLTGMIVSDNSTIELGSDFEVEVEGWVDTTLSANASLVFKDDAFRTYIDGANAITSEIHRGGVFPTVEAVNGGNDVVDQLNHTVNLPAGIVAGDLLLVFFGSDGGTAIGWPGGWTELFEKQNGVNETLAVGYRIADGGEGANITVTTAAIQMTAHTTYRISGYGGVPEAGTSVTGADINPNPPNMTPSWGAVNTLWFAVCGYDAGTFTVAAYPANYTDGRNDRANNAGGAGLGVARRELNAASEDPGTFTLSNAGTWIANTVAIAPADLEVTATSISSGEYTVKTYGIANEPAWATGDVLHFTGANTSNVNATAINDNIPNLWVSSWFRLDSTFSAASATDQFIWGKYIDATHYVYAYLESDDGKLYFEFDDGGVNPFSLTSTTVSWTGGTWYHTINSLDNTPAQRLLVNGVAEDTDTVAASNTPNGGDFCFGDFDDPGAVTGFVGEIQNVVIGTDILLVAEEAALYAGTAPGDETDYWYADEGTGTVITSYGSAANVGTADTACTWETATFTTGKTGRLCDFYIEVDDGIADPDRWGANLKGASVLDNGNDWEFFLNDAMPYVYRDEITVGGVLHAWHEWEYDTTFHDKSYYGLSFDANDDRVVVTDDDTLDLTDELTIEGWVQIYSTGGAKSLLGKATTIWTQASFVFEINVQEKPIFKTSSTGGGSSSINSNFVIAVDTWYYLVATFDRPIRKVYVDGDLKNSDSWDFDIFVGTSDLYIGRYADNSATTDGMVDEIRIYNRELEQDEITDNYNAGQGSYTPSDTTGLVGWWHAEEGSGTNLADFSGEGNTGTLQNGVAWVNGKVPRPAGSSGTNDATPSFRTASSDVDVVATAVNFQPIEEAKAPAWSLSTSTATWYSASNVTGNFTTTPSPTFPGASVIADISAATGTPAQLPFTILYGFIILAVSLSLSSVLRRYGSRSLLVKVIVIGGMLGIGEALGLIDLWMLLFFLIMAITFMAASKPGEVI